MPRRPRPVTRKPPQTVLHNSGDVKQDAPMAQKTKPHTNVKFIRKRELNDNSSTGEDVNDISHDSDEEPGDEDDEENASALEEPREQHIDVDAPRVAQWVGEDDFDSQVDSEESEEDSEEEGASDFEEGSSTGGNMRSLQDDLSSLPFGTLRKAQQALAKAKTIADSEDDMDSEKVSDHEPEEIPTSTRTTKGKQRQKTEITKRKNKHAPTEVTSKKPVPRKKIEIEEKKSVPRDPRFLHLAGEFSAQKFRSQYGFLTDLHTDELKTLRENYKRAKKLLVNSPRDLREQREQEVQRLERALKRAESTVNRDRREKIEQSALQKVADEERERRKEGKKAWFMKDSDKKEVLVKAKYDALAASGGRRAVKKAMDKKQKKVSQKEKKKRPFGPGQGGRGEGTSSNAKRYGGDFGGDGSQARKRQRVA